MIVVMSFPYPTSGHPSLRFVLFSFQFQTQDRKKGGKKMKKITLVQEKEIKMFCK